ncbi:MAG: type II toxin-antitoxin system VapC family toxin [Anaerolineae bacterium]
MKSYVTDTHPLLWYLSRDRRLSRRVRTIFEKADAGQVCILVPTIVLIEAVLLGDGHRLSDSLVQKVLELSEEEGVNYRLVPLDGDVVCAFREFGPAAIPEMPDRIIAATARSLNAPLLTIDPALSASGLVEVLW